MIAFLSGKLYSKLSDSVILLVNGVGYRVLVAASTFSSITVSSSLELFIHTHVREDCLDLYGFKTIEELNLFNQLLSVSGIGPKTGLLVIDKGVEPVKNAVLKADVDFFSLIPRLGKKNSQKIIIELKNKLGATTDLDLSSETPEVLEAAEALISMGYSKKEALIVLKGVAAELTIQEKIKYALRNISAKLKT